MPNNELPQRFPFTGPPSNYPGAPADVVERFADAVREWAHHAAPTPSSRCRGEHSPGTAEPNRAEGRR